MSQREKSKKQIPWELFGGILTAFLLLAVILLMALLGANAYRAVLGAKRTASGTRTAFSYLRSQVRAHDAAGCVELREDGQLLVLKEEDGRYELRVFVQDGYLRENLAKAGTAVQKDKGARIAEMSAFQAAFTSEGALLLTTDQGNLLIELQAGGDP